MDLEEVSGLPPGAVSHFHEEGIESLYPPQAEAVEAGATDGESLVAAVPTASGKTMIAALAMLSAVQRGGKALYIVPLRALASEKREEFAAYEAFGVDVGVTTGNYESTDDWLATKDIVVATSEKVDSLVRNGADWLSELTCVVSDEVHLVDDRNRGPTLEVTLAKLRKLNPQLQVVALSATVGNADEIAAWLDAELVASDWRPIDLEMGVHYGSAISFADGSKREVAVDDAASQEAALVEDIVEEGGSSLVFVSSRRNAEAAARRLSGVVESQLTDDERERLAELADEIRDVSDSETSDDLANCVEGGGAFHHAGLCVTGDTQILRSDGTFDDIRSIVTGDADQGNVIGMTNLELDDEEIVDTFEMGERPVFTVRTRTGNEIRLSGTHPLPVLNEEGLDWVPASELREGDRIARPRQIDADVDNAPAFRELVSDDHFVYREYETVARLASGLERSELPSTYYDAQTRNRNITVGDFRILCDLNEESAHDLFDRAICNGGTEPVVLPERVNKDVCWLAGAVAGDGYVDDHGVVLTGRSDLLSEFDRIVSDQFDRSTRRDESPSGTPFSRLNAKIVADIFVEHFGMPRCEGDISLPDIGLPDDEFGAFVSGLFDADGSVSPRANADGSPCVEFYSTSDEIINQLKTGLLRFGIVGFRDERNVEGRVTEYNGREIRSLENVNRLTIYGTEQLRKFENNIGFRHEEKAAKLRSAIERNPEGGRQQNDVIPSAIGKYVRTIREERDIALSDLEPEVPKATLSRFERGLTPIKRSTFQSLTQQLGHDKILADLGSSDVFWDRIESIEKTGAEPLFDLSTTSENFVANGIIAHNTSDHRTLVEDAFRERLLKVIAATPTLAAGVNTPARRVIVRDWRRYDPTAGGMSPLPVLEVHQMMGRAGRPGLDPYGEAVLLANSHDDLDELFERYVWADPEAVRSKLAAEPALRTHVLATVASGFARTREGLLEFLDETLYASQSSEAGRLETVTDTVLDYLERNDFVERHREGAAGDDSAADDDSPAGDDPAAGGDAGAGAFTSAADLIERESATVELAATSLGHTVSRLYLDPMTAAEIVHGLEDADQRPTPMGLYQLIARTPDMYELYLRSGEDEEYGELYYELEDELLGDAPSEYEDARFEDWLAALKTGALLKDWADEMDEDRITERYQIGPGDLRGKVDTAEWLLGAAETLAGEIGSEWTVAVREARARVEHGVREELLELVSVRGVGRKRARQLYEVGVESAADLREVDKSVVLWALKGEKTAESILENAGREDPSMDGVEPRRPDGADVGQSSPTAARAERAVSEQADADDDQSSLGDF